MDSNGQADLEGSWHWDMEVMYPRIGKRSNLIFNTWLKLELIKRTRPKKTFLKGLKLVLVNNVSVIFYQLNIIQLWPDVVIQG